jgi:hypothetical protein
MFASHETTASKSRCKKARTAKRTEDQDEDFDSMNSEEKCARDKRNNKTFKNAPDKTKNSVKFVIP